MYSQRDPRWKGELIGTSNDPIGKQGCLVCVAADIVSALVKPMNPSELNKHLTEHQGFVKGNRFVFSSLVDFGLSITRYDHCVYRPAPVGAIMDAFTSGQRVGLEIYFPPVSRRVTHWLGLVGFIPDDLLVYDPWTKSGDYPICRLRERYSQFDADLARMIVRWIAYELKEPAK